MSNIENLFKDKIPFNIISSGRTIHRFFSFILWNRDHKKTVIV